jgi:hypothetical protein
MVRVTIDSIRVDLRNHQQVVILKEESAERYLPIWIGPTEARAIAIKLQGAEVARPLSHDLLCSVIHALGATVECTVVSELESDVFYATIILRIDDEEVEVDSRPSDALALAVRTQAPVYAEEAVLEQAGIWLDEETGKPIPAEGQGETNRKRRKVSQEDLQGMSAFADFISTLNLDDIDRDE